MFVVEMNVLLGPNYDIADHAGSGALIFCQSADGGLFSK